MLGVPPESLVARGLEAADRALREDSMSADAWSGRGMVLFFQVTPAYNEALAALQRAVLLDSGNALAHQNYATVLRRLGSYEQALAEYRRGIVRGEPTASQTVSDIGFIFYAQRRYREALAWYDSAVVFGATHNTWVLRARARIAVGDTAGALEDAAMATRLATPSARIRNEIFAANIQALAGDTARARSRLEPALAASLPDGPMTVRHGYEVVAALTALGERDRAIAVLERIQPRGAWLWSYLVWREFDPLRSDPRFQRVYLEAKPPGAPDPPMNP
jgi:tetratricopeptide (TPR) repeat protein